MPDIDLIENLEKLTHVREKLAFIYDCFSQSDNFEFSGLGGNLGITLILEELVKELQEVESAFSIVLKEHT
jgi:hypothetical protein